VPVADSDNKTSSAGGASFREITGGFLFYFGIPAIMLYPLGFMALGLQLWRDYDFPYGWASGGFNFAMLWYATSLVPKVVVIGTGIRLLFLSLLCTVLIMAVASATLHFLRKPKLLKGRTKREQTEDHGRWEGLGKWERRLWRLAPIILVPLMVLLLSSDFPFDSWYDVPFYVGYFAFSALGGVVIGYIRFWGHDRWLHHGLSLAFVGAIFGALSLSAMELPDLPVVELEAGTNWPNELSGTPFRLLANDTQHWYVYNRQSGMLALEQGDVKSIRYWDETQRRPPEASPDKDGRVNPD
jgi:hypothetical protein